MLHRYPYNAIFASPLHKSVALCFFLLLFASSAKAQWAGDKIVQINGVLMTADSLRSVPEATIQVKGSERGTYASEHGVFTLVALKGDSLVITALGFKPVEVVVPNDVKGKFYSMIQLMVQDTFYLPETIIRPLPSPGEFDYAFRNWSIPDDRYEQARKATESNTLRVLSYTLPRDSRENQAAYQRREQYDLQYYGVNTRPTNIFSPFAWAEFFEAWKRGDFKKVKNYKK